jgi:DNA-binding transcriptional MocR family regulator
VLFAPGSQFYSDGRPSNAMRLAFAMAGEDALRRGVERLARVVAAHRANGAPATGRVPV